MITDEVITRFWAKVERRGQDACWPWLGDTDPKGYGKMRIYYRRWFAHRVSLMIKTGENPPSSIYALHSCDNPNCVNPNHLRWGSAKQNAADRLERTHRKGMCANHGESNGRATLTAQQVLEIRADCRTFSTIATAFGTSKGTVCNIKARRTWRHLEN